MHRPYRDHADLLQMQQLASELWRRQGPLASTHVGDLPWRMYQHIDRLSRDRVEVWLDDNIVVGWGWLDVADSELDFEVNPERLDLVAEIIEWSGARSVWQLETHAERVREVERAGFTRRDEDWYEHMIRSLDELPPPEVPAGYRAHSMEEGDLARRVEVHRQAFAPSRVVGESYRAVTQAFPYRAALDHVIEAPDGTYAAFALGWLDVDNRVGELEPVGTHPAHRRRGLAAAVSLAALHALHDAGAKTGLVYSNGGSEASRVYERIGFKSLARHVRFERT
jgi:ribosomal protein S18 acetylase RimI-like enzyme